MDIQANDIHHERTRGSSKQQKSFIGMDWAENVTRKYEVMLRSKARKHCNRRTGGEIAG